jgi:hypothetical protein
MPETYQVVYVYISSFFIGKIVGIYDTLVGFIINFTIFTLRGSAVLCAEMDDWIAWSAYGIVENELIAIFNNERKTPGINCG